MQSTPSCRDVQRWLQTASATSQPLTPQLVAHIRECAVCRGAMYTLLASVLPNPTATISCELCQDDLAEFIDIEATNPRRAIERFPALWQHLWFCADCLEVYEITRSIMLHEEDLWSLHDLPVAPPDMDVTLNFQPLLHIAPSQLVAQWRDCSDAKPDLLVIRSLATVADSPFCAAIEAHRDVPHVWSLRVTLLPAQAMIVRLTLGSYQCEVRLDVDGTAIFGDIPEHVLLSDNDGLTLEIATIS